ncbi:MAG: hypothetical protein Q7V63_07645 [Gammaproteobacteria bacterium]|nr:hypothetical protein [Gammaproteobacteria bacterium]
MSTLFTIKLNSSKSLWIILVLLHFLALIIVWNLPLSLWIKFITWVSIGVSFMHSLAYARRKLPHSLITISLGSRASWHGLSYNGEMHNLQIASDTIVTSRVICLHARNEHEVKLRSLIFSWEHSPASYRQLAKALRIQKMNLQYKS